MAVYEDIVKGVTKNVTVTGLLVGLGVVILAPVVIGVAASILRPVVQTAVKEGVALYDRGKAAASETAEAARELTAEARADLERSRGKAG